MSTRIAVVRQDDLEARELAMFDRLASATGVEVFAVGGRPTTPYGTDGLTIPIRTLHSFGDTLDRLPLGQTVRQSLEARLGRSTSGLLGFERALGEGVDILSPRETFQHSSLLACRYAETRPHTRVVVSVFENIPFRYDDAPIQSEIKRQVGAAADLFIANSSGAADALEMEGIAPERVRVIPPGIDTESFSPGPRVATIRARWQVEPDDTVILFAGRLIREKGLVELLMALRDLLGGSTGVRPVIVFHGKGPEEHRVRLAARALGVADRVRFSPWVATRDMPDVYRSADIVVLPSLPTPYWLEQFGYNLAEAMACGRPVIATDCGAINEVLGGTGVVVPPYDRNAFSTAVASLLEDPARREKLGSRAREHAHRTYSVDAAGRALLASFADASSLPKRKVVFDA